MHICVRLFRNKLPISNTNKVGNESSTGFVSSEHTVKNLKTYFVFNEYKICIVSTGQSQNNTIFESVETAADYILPDMLLVNERKSGKGMNGGKQIFLSE